MKASLLGKKVVSAFEMRRIETKAIQQGCLEEAFMDQVAEKIAFYLGKEKKLPSEMIILAGKGNNGGDGYTLATLLQEKNIVVTVYTPFSEEEGSSLCKKKRKIFQKKGGRIVLFKKGEKIYFPKQAWILDALLGTGFQGALQGELLHIVQQANACNLPIFSIDIPSGVDATTGEVKIEAIRSKKTFALGLYKTGYFLQQGWNHVGRLTLIDFGLPPIYEEEAKEEFYLLQEEKLAAYLPPIERKRHKYEAGCVIGVAGSKGMTGAAKLASLASLRAGAGICYLFYAPNAEKQMQLSPFEILAASWGQAAYFQGALKKAKAVFIGPGMGRDKKAASMLTRLLSALSIPLVLDADALFLLSQKKKMTLPPFTILTPHEGERKKLFSEKDFFSDSQRYVEKNRCILVAKGSPTWVFSPQQKPVISPFGDPGMATAGAGDVLTGILAALLAQGLSPFLAASLGVCLHGIAGEKGAEKYTSYSLIASDIIASLPEAFQYFLV